MKVILVYFTIFIIPMYFINKKIDKIQFDISTINLNKSLKRLKVIQAISASIWFFFGSIYSLLIGNALWKGYIEDGQEYFSEQASSLLLITMISGFIYIYIKGRFFKKKLIKFHETIPQQIQEEKDRSKQRFKELLQKDLEKHQKKLEKIKNLLELYSKEYNIDSLTIQRMYEMLESWQGESIDPFNSLYASILRKQEFKSLYDLGLIRQDSHFPYLFTFEKIEDIPLILSNVIYTKDRKMILPDTNVLDNLSDGFEFEQYIAVLLEKNGYSKIEVLPMSGDYGVDILAEKSEVNYAFQCKYYSQPVGISAVQEVSSGKTHYNAHVGVVVTNNYFTSNALKLAETNGILMWDRDKILKMTIKLKKRELEFRF